MRAVVHRTDSKFIRVSGCELFVMSREHAPSIIFMDEIDSIGSSRGESGSGGGDSEVQRTMLELLNQLDGFESTKNIKVIMATNRIGTLFVLFDVHVLTLLLQIFLTLLCSDPVVLTVRLNSHHRAQKLV